MLEWINKDTDLKMLNIDDNITQSLIKDFNIPEKEAIDIYFSSDTYNKINDVSTGLINYKWENIYELLKKEINTN